MSTKNEIFDYVMNSPENTNAAVLGSMLNDLEGEDTGDIYTVKVTQVKSSIWDEEPWALDKQVSEIFAAFRAGKQIVAEIYPYQEQSPKYSLTCIGLGKIVYGFETLPTALSFEWIYYWDKDQTFKKIYLDIFEEPVPTYGSVFYYEE